MPVTTLNDQYSDMTSEWEKMRACIAGQKAIHKLGETYLPRLSGQTDQEYKNYRDRGLFLGATAKTVDSLVGTVFRKPIEYEVPPAMADWMLDVTADGTSLEQLCRESLGEMMSVGRFGLLVDYPAVEDAEGLTMAMVEAIGLRPRVKMYAAENIINWKTTTVGNKEVLTLVVLHELVEDPADEFDTNSMVDQWRVLDLSEDGYRMRVYTTEDTYTEVFPKMNGRTMDFIPFIIVGPEGEYADVQKPPLLDLANINISHYQAYADYRHGLHFTGLPTAVVTGHAPDWSLSIGSGEAWVFTEADAKAYYLEFDGKGLQAYRDEITELETDMAIFGAQVLREQKKAAEAAETAAINRIGETSTLANWASVVGDAVRHALEIMRDWAGFSGEVALELNKDFMPYQMDANTMRELLAAVQAGKISYETYYWNLQRGEVASESRDAEEEMDLIELDGPSMVGGVDDGPTP